MTIRLCRTLGLCWEYAGLWVFAGSMQDFGSLLGVCRTLGLCWEYAGLWVFAGSMQDFGSLLGVCNNAYFLTLWLAQYLKKNKNKKNFGPHLKFVMVRMK